VKIQQLAWRQKGEVLVETALAVPLVLAIFAGCAQIVQIGLAHIVVREATYEAGRQYWMDNSSGNAGRVAAEICSRLSSGRTVFAYDAATGLCTVTHQLNSLFSIVKNIKISHSLPAGVFRTEQEEDDQP
jgi:hypothetical protein